MKLNKLNNIAYSLLFFVIDVLQDLSEPLAFVSVLFLGRLFGCGGRTMTASAMDTIVGDQVEGMSPDHELRTSHAAWRRQPRWLKHLVGDFVN